MSNREILDRTWRGLMAREWRGIASVRPHGPGHFTDYSALLLRPTREEDEG